MARRPPAALDGARVWQVPVPLDPAAMHEAGQRLVGRHDFTSFRASQCQARSPLKTLDVLDVTEEGARIVVTAQARSFLHSQVRAMVGSLRLVGDGHWTPDDVTVALEKKDRAAAGPTAPPQGLYLTAVSYD